MGRYVVQCSGDPRSPVSNSGPVWDKINLRQYWKPTYDYYPQAHWLAARLTGTHSQPFYVRLADDPFAIEVKIVDRVEVRVIGWDAKGYIYTGADIRDITDLWGKYRCLVCMDIGYVCPHDNKEPDPVRRSQIPCPFCHRPR